MRIVHGVHAFWGRGSMVDAKDAGVSESATSVVPEARVPPSGDTRVLKADALGRIECCLRDDAWVVRRSTATAHWWVRGFARWAARREAGALARLRGVEGVPQLLGCARDEVIRSYLPGRPMQQARPTSRAYFRDAHRLLSQLHRRGVLHNDLAKEPNWLVLDDGRPGLVDFQLAWTGGRRTALFRLLAREDLRHLLKHKRTYASQWLTARERAILTTPALHSRIWRATFKRLYKLVARRIFGYWDNEGRGRIRD